MNIKKAAVYSLIITVFSQGSSLIAAAIPSGYGAYDLSLLPYLVAAAVIGSVIGILVSTKLSEKAVKIFFTVMQSLVLCLVIYNIIMFSAAYYHQTV